MKIFHLTKLPILLSFLILGTGTAWAQTSPSPEETPPAAEAKVPFLDRELEPQRVLSRAELAAVLVRTFPLAERKTAEQADPISYVDVPASHWAYDPIQIVSKTGVMTGYRPGQFFPNQRVTRAEALAVFAQAYGVFQFPPSAIAEILSPYPDADQIPAWARKPLATAIYEGFVNVDEDSRIRPNQPMTHGDLAYTLEQYQQRQQNPFE